MSEDFVQTDLRMKQSGGALISGDSFGVSPQVQAPELVQQASDEGFLPATVAAAKRYSPYAWARYAYHRNQLSDENPEPGFNPYQMLDDSYAPYADLFSEANNEHDVVEIKSYIETIRNEKRIANSNVWGNLLGTLIGTATTTIPLLPLSEVLPATQTLTGTALRGAAFGAVLDIPIEAGLMATDPQFKLDEAWTGVALSAILGGVLEPLIHVNKFKGFNVRPATADIQDTITSAFKGKEALDLSNLKSWQVPSKYLSQESKFFASNDIPPLSAADYAKGLADEGLAPATGPLAPVFNFFTKTTATYAQPSIAARLLNSASLATRKLTNQLVEHQFVLGKNVSGGVSEASVEALADSRILARTSQIDSALEDGYQQALKAGQKISRTEFSEAVAAAARRQGKSEIPGVSSAAAVYRRVMDDVEKRYKEAGLLTDENGLDLPDGESYFTQVFDREKITADPKGFRNMLATELRTNGVPEAEIAGAVEDIRAKIMNKRYLDNDFISWTDKNLKSRSINISSLKLEPWLANDVSGISKSYLTRAEKDLALVEKFGTANKDKILESINADYKALMANETDNAKLVKLQEGLDRDVQLLGVLYDRILGTRGRPVDPYSIGSTAVNAIRGYNVSRMLGSVGLSMLSEVSRAQLSKFFSKALKTRFENMGLALDKIKLSKADLEQLGFKIGHSQRLEMLMQGEAVLHNPGRPASKIQQGSDFLAKATLRYSGMEMLDRLNKSILGETAANNFINRLKAVEAGKASARDIEALAKAGIDPKQAKQYLALAEKYGEHVEGAHYLNVSKWDGDLGDSIRTAIRKEVEGQIAMPNVANRFLFADASPTAKLIMQFRSYLQAAFADVLLPGMQRGDARMLSTIVTLLGVGYLVTYLKAKIAGRDPKDINMAVETVNNSGALPFVFDMYSVGSNALFGGGTQRQQIQGRLDTILGPTAGLFSRGLPAVLRAVQGETSPGDVGQLKSLVPLNNLVWWDWYLKQLKNETADKIRAERKIEKASQGRLVTKHRKEGN